MLMFGLDNDVFKRFGSGCDKREAASKPNVQNKNRWSSTASLLGQHTYSELINTFLFLSYSVTEDAVSLAQHADATTDATPTSQETNSQTEAIHKFEPGRWSPKRNRDHIADTLRQVEQARMAEQGRKHKILSQLRHIYVNQIQPLQDVSGYDIVNSYTLTGKSPKSLWSHSLEPKSVSARILQFKILINIWFG